MPSNIERLISKDAVHPPKFVKSNMCFEGLTGSVAYGCSSDTSDMDIVGFCIPPKNIIFPHLDGYIEGFGKKPNRFEVWQEHHVLAEEKEYDFSIYSIIKFMQLCMEGNPNMIDVLFLPQRCILYTNQIGQMIREARHSFLHKGCFPKFKGYIYAQRHRMDSTPNEKRSPKRLELIEKYGFDTKFAYHIPRLLLEVEQILIEGDLDLERNREMLKSIRRGEWKKEDIIQWCQEKEKGLEKAYENSKLPYGPNEDGLKQLLLNCLEHHYGSLDKVIVKPNKEGMLLQELRKLVERCS